MSECRKGPPGALMVKKGVFVLLFLRAYVIGNTPVRYVFIVIILVQW